MNIQIKNGKEYVFDRIRKQFVRLTPEESVRQQFVEYLIEQKHYPEGLLANEVTIQLGNVSRRCDTVLYDRQLQPQMIIEYKAPNIEISQKTFDQIMRYNSVLHVPWLIVCNGRQYYCCQIHENNTAEFLKEIPEYVYLCETELRNKLK